MLNTSSDPILQSIGKSITKFLEDNVDSDIVDSHSVAGNGFVKFFQAIANFFKKIGEFFKKLFKIK